jgi:tetratricopeptide (TPR) repeat protein
LSMGWMLKPALLLFLLSVPLFSQPAPVSPEISSGPARKALLEEARQERDGARAAVHYQKLIASGPRDDTSEEAWFRLGQFYYARGEYPSALRMFDSLLVFFPAAYFKSEALFLKGLCFLSTGAGDSAATLLGRLTEEDPAVYVKGRIVLGVLLSRNGRFVESNACLEKALAMGDNALRSTAYFQLSQNYKALGDRKQAALFAGKLRDEFPDALEAPQMEKELQPLVSGQALANAAPAVPKEEYALQLGAFQSRENAEKLQKKYADTYGNTDVAELKREGGPLFTVRLGRFKSSKDAESFAALELNLAPKEFKVVKR